VSEEVDRYQYLTLQPGETHFVKKSSALAAQSQLHYMRRRFSELKDRSFSSFDTMNGVIVVRNS
jgi:hypothetical protein